ncbi:MAG: 1-deoxy-D-xylulose-5-phosphate synthase N-terminal domain-containing protein, partial [Nitrospiria bacterium]
MSLLEKINSPRDLRAMPRKVLPTLAEEIRALILKTVSDKGGHLGASLGTVELTLALHA